MSGSAGAALRGTGAGVRVLVVDDEPHITEVLATTLRFAGFEVAVAASGAQALAAAEAEAPQLVVLDVMLPDMDGFTVCRRLREIRPTVPVLFLTARDTTEDKVAGLTLGGDDYLTKPFAVAEVIARIQAILRRTRAGAADTGVLRVADLELDEDAHEVRRAGARIDLSPTEFKLLRYLLANAGRVVSKSQILDHVWNYDFGGDAGVVEKFVSQLRRKIDVENDGTPLLHTVRGFGYTLKPRP
ncbi:MAG: response regulator transcription factor [Mycobacteriales bacterium]